MKKKYLSIIGNVIIDRMMVILAFCLLSGTALAQQANQVGESQDMDKTDFKERRSDLYHEVWIDFNKNGKMDPYENKALAIDKRVEDLLTRMTMEEKTVQMVTLYGYRTILQDEIPQPNWKEKLWKDGIANIDEHINCNFHLPTKYTYPYPNHARAINEVQRWFVEETRLGIPVDFSNEGIRGLAYYQATSFPAQIGLGCTFNADLIYNVGLITGREARALGYTNVYAPILDISRDPRWGRTVESYGEDPYLAGTLGVEMVRGLQNEGVVSTPKHFAVYSVPKGGRDGQTRTDPQVTPREMHELYLMPFRKAFTRGKAMGTMSSYNDWNGLPITGSRFFLTELLREHYGFDGYVVSDSRAVSLLEEKHKVAVDYKDAVRQAVEAGLNVRTDFTPPEKYVDPLRELIREGRLSEEIINSRVADVLRVKMRLGLFDQPYVEDPDAAARIVRSNESQILALRAARESLVLLKNEGKTLPLNASKLKNILVTGPMADATGYAISRYGPSGLDVISVLKGIREYVGSGVDVHFEQGVSEIDGNWPESELYPGEPIPDSVQVGIDRAVQQAAAADVVIAVLGGGTTVGEGKSRTSLELPGHQAALLSALKAAGKPIILVLINGRPLTINWADKNVPAILEAWFPGERSGQVVAEALFGKFSPGGKLSMTFPKTVGEIPYNFPTKRGGQNPQGWPGVGLYDIATRVHGVLYPFGHGLSYTSFEYTNLHITPEKQHGAGTVEVSFEIINTGDRAGDEVAQLYVIDPVTSVVYYEKQLRGFKRLTLDPGEKQTVTFTLSPEDLWLLDNHMQWTVEKGRFDIEVGSSSEDIRLKGSFEITESASFGRPPRD